MSCGSVPCNITMMRTASADGERCDTYDFPHSTARSTGSWAGFGNDASNSGSRTLWVLWEAGKQEAGPVSEIPVFGDRYVLSNIEVLESAER